MLGDDVQEKAVKLTYEGFTISSRIINEIIQRYLNRLQTQSYDNQSLKRLNIKEKALNSMPVASKDLIDLQKELKKFDINCSVMKSLSQKDKYEIYFKGSEISQIQTALKNYTSATLQKNQSIKKPSIKERMKSAVNKAKDLNKSLKSLEIKLERGHAGK